jgi:hypothetical protein
VERRELSGSLLLFYYLIEILLDLPNETVYTITRKDVALKERILWDRDSSGALFLFYPFLYLPYPFLFLVKRDTSLMRQSASSAILIRREMGDIWVVWSDSIPSSGYHSRSASSLHSVGEI